jgi:hypothetical protein
MIHHFKETKYCSQEEIEKNNKKTMNVIMDGLHDSSTKELWDKLHNLYFKEYPLIAEPEHANQNK